ILKYHGICDWEWRTTFMPSVSMNNDAAYTVTSVEFDAGLESDSVEINGARAQGREADRVTHLLDKIRFYAGANTCARVVSKNVTKAKKTGKGLGTSASASAALATAAISAAWGADYAKNPTLTSAFGRLLAGSGSRSAAGGIALWLSYAGIPHEDSFSVRLDSPPSGNAKFEDMRLVTIPIDSRIKLKTEIAHHHAPLSPFFKDWAMLRKKQMQDFFQVLERDDWEGMAKMAEADTLLLHSVTMGHFVEVAWEPETLALMRMCGTLRDSGTPVYYSIDTGPTVVLMTDRKGVKNVISGIEEVKRYYGFDLEYVDGKVAGPSVLVDKYE
ncbi:MAG TPA: GHMP kinase, partial [Candidatus Micrarchaeota archaeon]|nr:GHMP kinase [Candidatus Micrarchaeota archaeon]